MRGTLARLVDIMMAIEAIDGHLTRGDLRDHLAHRYVDTDHAIVAATVERELPILAEAVSRLMRVIESDR